MGLKGALRSIQASARQAERNARRRQKELEKRQKELAKMQEVERASYEVELYENKIELLTTIHNDCGKKWNWKKIKSSASPLKPKKSNKNEKNAQKNLDEFKPNIFTKAFRKVESKRAQLAEKIEQAKDEDENNYQESLKNYKVKYSEWQERCELAMKIIAGDIKAYIETFNQINPLSEISSIGSSLEFTPHNSSIINVILHVNSEQVIPSEVKSLLKSGKLSIKKMTKGKFYELYQDYVCSCVLRVARELFALLPVKIVIITAVGNLLNSQTGHIEEQPILSVAIPKKTLNILNFSMIDPSDSMKNFIHNMNFKKTQGFNAVEKIKTDSLK
jgi:hypothetical protein